MLNHSKRNINFLVIGLSIIIFIIIQIYLAKQQEESTKNIGKETENEITIQDNIMRAEMNQTQIEEQEEIILQTGLANIEEIIVNEQKNIVDENNIIWKIKIPKIALDASIASGTTQDVLLESVGHFEESQMWDGNVALAAHNRGNKCNFFQNIRQLEKGDKIIYKTNEGTREYMVEITTIIKDTDWSYVKNTEDNRITLITCLEDQPEYRRCVQAKEVKTILER